MGTLGDMLVLVDFKGQLDDELKIKTGDVIQNVKKTAEEGWLEGEFNGKRGFFPQMFVKEIPPFFLNDNAQRYPRSIRKPNASIAPKNPKEELPDTQAPTDGYAGVNKKKRWCRAEYTYKASSADELDLSVGDTFEVLEEIEDGWYLGKKGDVVGAFPSNFVKEIPEPPSDKIPEHSKNAKKRPAMMDINFSAKEEGKCKQDDKPVPENQSKVDSSLPQAKEYCRVMFNYIPFLPDELALKKGDVILLISKETGDEGWWQGEHNGKTGLFPDNFVIPIPPDMQNKTNKLPTRTSTIKGPVTKSDLNIMDKKPQEVNKSAAEVNKHEPTATKGQKGQHEPKSDHTPKVNNQPAKKSAPPPPVPNKVKHNAAGPFNKPSTETGEDVNHSSKESNTLDGLRVSSVKLAHPTADRPKMMGKRLPKGKKPVAESDDKKAEEKVNSHKKVSSSTKDPRISSTTSPASSPTKTSSLSPLAASTMKQSQETSENHVSSVQSLKVEDVAAEIASLKFMMDLLRIKHAKDMEDIRSEMNEERAKRLALQMEVEHLKNLSSA